MAIANITNNILTDSGVATSALQIALNGTGFVKIVGTTISYDNSTYLTTSSAASTYQTILTNPITGTGTTNYLPKFTGASTIGNSAITDDGSTVSVGNTLKLSGNSNSFQVASIFRNANRVFFGGDTGGYYFQNSGNTATILNLNDSGNLGLGVTPSAWATVSPVFQIGTASLYGYNNSLSLSSNAYYNAGDKYIQTGFATQYYQSGGNHTWYNAPSGTAGNAISFTQAMTLFSDGNLLLTNGTVSNAGYKLDVNGTGRFSGKLTISNTSDVYAEMTTSSVDGDNFFGFSNTGDGNSSWGIGRRNTGEFWIANYTGNFLSGTRTTPLVIASTGAATFSGNVGVGTSPSVLLHLAKASAANQLWLQSTTGTNAAYMNFINSGGNNYFGVDNSSGTGLFATGGAAYGFSMVTESAYPLVFGTNNTERMRITSGGNLLVGTTDNGAKLQVAGTTSIANGLYVGGSTNPNNTIVFSGLVISNNAGTYPLKWNSSTGVVSFDGSSRLGKKDIVNSPYGLAEILKLTSRKYYRIDDNKEEIGLIADEVQGIMPEFVPMVKKSLFTKIATDTEMIAGGVNYDKLTSVLIKAIQEQNETIINLTNRLNKIENK